MKWTLSVLLIAFSLNYSFGATRTAVATGNWNTPGNWDCNCVPSDTDNVIIPAGVKITIPFPGVEMLNPAIVVVTVYGELVLTNSTLSLNSSDQIIIPTGGKISTSGLGGLITSGLSPIATFPINGPATISNGALPIELNYFTASETEDGVIIAWESAIEENLSKYIIERSADGLIFENIYSRVPMKYEFVDQNPRLGRSYYRLKTQDIDGSCETFELVSVTVTKIDARVHVYPNPLINGILTIESNVSFLPGDYVRIMTALGNPVMNIDLSGFSQSFDLTSLEAGIYYVELRTQAGTFKKRFIRQ
jgi:hypothetical protein